MRGVSSLGRPRARRRLLAGRVALPPPRRRAARERVDLYFEDGSMVSLADGSPEADALLRSRATLLAAAAS